MSIYKITNITNLAGKRDLQFNSILDISYVDEMMKKSVKVKPGETVYLTILSLPLSVHRLRVKKLVSVVEITKTELKNVMNIVKPIVPKKVEIVENVNKEVIFSERKKLTKKSHDDKSPDTE